MKTKNKIVKNKLESEENLLKVWLNTRIWESNEVLTIQNTSMSEVGVSSKNSPEFEPLNEFIKEYQLEFEKKHEKKLNESWIKKSLYELLAWDGIDCGGKSQYNKKNIMKKIAILRAYVKYGKSMMKHYTIRQGSESSEWEWIEGGVRAYFPSWDYYFEGVKKTFNDCLENASKKGSNNETQEEGLERENFKRWIEKEYQNVFFNPEDRDPQKMGFETGLKFIKGLEKLNDAEIVRMTRIWLPELTDSEFKKGFKWAMVKTYEDWQWNGEDEFKTNAQLKWAKVYRALFLYSGVEDNQEKEIWKKTAKKLSIALKESKVDEGFWTPERQEKRAAALELIKRNEWEWLGLDLIKKEAGLTPERINETKGRMKDCLSSAITAGAWKTANQLMEWGANPWKMVPALKQNQKNPLIEVVYYLMVAKNYCYIADQWVQDQEQTQTMITKMLESMMKGAPDHKKNWESVILKEIQDAEKEFMKEQSGYVGKKYDSVWKQIMTTVERWGFQEELKEKEFQNEAMEEFNESEQETIKKGRKEQGKLRL